MESSWTLWALTTAAPCRRAGKTRLAGRGDLEGAAPDVRGLALYESEGDLPMSAVQDALVGTPSRPDGECGAGDAHMPGCLGLSQAFQVSQAQGFQLFEEQGHKPQSLGTPSRPDGGRWPAWERV